MSKISGVDLVWCWVSDLGRAVEFYRDVLGAEVVSESPYWASLSLGGFKIGLHPGLETPNQGGFVLALLTDDVQAFQVRLREVGVWVAEELHETPRGRLVEFHDWDGNTLQALELSAQE